MSDFIDDDFKELPVTGLTAGQFPLGQVLIAADDAYELNRAFVEECLRRHASGDWGDVDPNTRLANARTVRGEDDFPIVSKYRVGDRPLQIATKADGSVTSIVLFVADYAPLPPDAGLPVRFDGYEIHGTQAFTDGWGLFGHIPGEGLILIGQFESRERAEEVYARITGRLYVSRP